MSNVLAAPAQAGGWQREYNTVHGAANSGLGRWLRILRRKQLAPDFAGYKLSVMHSDSG